MNIPPEQTETARFLTVHSGREPKQTHISAVFIGADTVWKLKKAVRMPFLDYTTVAAREHFLRRELELNQPAAPGIYRDVIAISRRPDGRLELGGSNPIDWVLRMARIPDDDFLDAIASRGGVTPKLLDDLADCVAAYHAKLPPIRNHDSASALLRITGGNKQSGLAEGLPPADVTAWHSAMVSAIKARRGWLAERSAAGYVRRCHGDLHLGNLCLWEGTPVPFDALEFNEEYATIDVAYDLAFLLMDVEHRVGRTAANQVMNRYVARTGDIAMAGYPIFLSQRAMIRAHVLKSMEQDGDAYLAAAQHYVKPATSVVVAIGGLQGTGKSTIARALAPELGPAPGALVLRSDEIRKRLHHADPATRLGPGAYTPAANIETNRVLIGQSGIAAMSGHGLIVDATFLDPAMRDDLADAIRPANVRFLGVWLHAHLSVLESRVSARSGDASDATVDVLRRSAANDPGPGTWLPVDATDTGAALNQVRQMLRN